MLGFRVGGMGHRACGLGLEPPRARGVGCRVYSERDAVALRVSGLVGAWRLELGISLQGLDL